VGKLRPHGQEQHLALFGHELRKGSGNSWSSKRGAQTVVTQRGVLAELRVCGQAGIELELVLFGPPMVSEEVRGYTEQPGPLGSLSGVEVIAPSVGGGEGLGCQVVGERSADAAGYETMDGREGALEAPLECGGVGEPPVPGTRRIRLPSRSHTYVLSLMRPAFPARIVTYPGFAPRPPAGKGRPMRKVTYSMGVSLDGYIVGPDGGLEWTAPDDEVFRFVTEEIRGVGAHLLGRRLYETMLYWENADQDPSLDDSMLEWAALWKALPKVVFSRTLTAVQGNARLASGGVAKEVERLRAEPGDSDIAIGGAALAAEAAAADLIDEYHARIYPVLVGGGTAFFHQHPNRVDLELVETRTFGSGVIFLRYRVAH
jgi:dihydrofolate reductase